MENKTADNAGKWIFHIDSIEKREKNKNKELFVRGWAFYSDGSIGQVQVCRDGKELGIAVVQEKRRDVAAVNKQYGDVTDCGFSCLIPYEGSSPQAELIVRNNHSSAELFSFGSSSGATLKKRLHRIERQMKFHTIKAARECIDKSQRKRKMQNSPYAKWKRSHQLSKAELDRQRRKKFSYEPKISIVVPAYKTPESFLRQMIESVRSQTYTNWELCIGDGSLDNSISGILQEYAEMDSRVKYKLLEENFGISGNTNGAMSIADGDYVSLLDHDDILTPDALYEIVNRINDTGAEVLYTDEDKVTMDLKHYFEPNFKPDFNLDLLRSCNYICHFFIVKKEIIQQVGGFNPECDGSQDFDFILRCTKAANKVSHIAKILYNWRCHPNSVAGNPEAKMYCYEAGKRALELALLEEQVSVEIDSHYGYYRVNYPLMENSSVAILIVERENKENTQLTIESIQKWTTYGNYTIKVLPFQESLAKTINLEALNSDAEYLLLMEAGMTVEQKDWLQRLVSNGQRKNVAAIGGHICEQDGTVVHSGRLLGGEAVERDMFYGSMCGEVGYTGRMIAQQDISAHSWKGMLVEQAAFKKAGGFEESLTEKYADTDLCLRIAKSGKRIIYTPYVSFLMSFTEYLPELREDAAAKAYMLEKWGAVLALRDPYDNPNFDSTKTCFQL